ncbi:MAG: UDP-N-acetylmuramate:L-alanyl-gamma-D-glutamyl-meso-diaminopimelate ligase [Verrucomicrobiales bacterium]|nr:UDP-N-acetylmuramate:L-alanyl-gamma-D-glutamyl-meso-diaminopimelate ligase [Verrucomicrobiota bacterium JB025]
MSEKSSFHFTGICGTAMGSVAAAMKQRGYTVTGSDANVYPPMSTFLRDQGITITEGYAEANIPADTDVVIIGNAISRGNPEAEAALDRKLLYHSLPEVMKEYFLRGKRNFVVSGTHGKTTTASLLAWLLRHAGRNPGFMIGGLPKNLGRGAMFTDSEFNVLEGDEYDTAFFDKRSKFLHYLPECLVINNIEFDHADIYNSLDEIKLSFKRVLNIVPRSGIALVNGDDPNCLDVSAGAPCPVTTVGFGENCSLRVENLKYDTDRSSFTLGGQPFSLRMTGEFNVRNAAMATAAARFAGLTDDEIRAGLEAFEGVARRQEIRGEVNGIKVIDDFAHHPTAIRLAIQSLRQRHPDSRLWVLFEPRSNTTRRAVFQNELAESLALADFAVVAAMVDLHKIPEHDRLDPEKLSADIKQLGGHASYIDGVDAIVSQVTANARPGDVLAVLSNGGFGGIHQKLLDALAR